MIKYNTKDYCIEARLNQRIVNMRFERSESHTNDLSKSVLKFRKGTIKRKSQKLNDKLKFLSNCGSSKDLIK